VENGILNKGIEQDSPLKKFGKNASSSSGKPKDGDSEVVVLALEAVDERTKNSVLRELKKRKIGS
jgi:hypothetical protein